MPNKFPIKINDVEIKTPTDFSISRYNLTKHGRLANGKMTMDLIAKKKKLFLTYGVLNGAQLNAILDLIDTEEMFFDVTYHEIDGTENTITCYVGEIPMPLSRRGTINDHHVWKDVEFNFIEQ